MPAQPEKDQEEEPLNFINRFKSHLKQEPSNAPIVAGLAVIAVFLVFASLAPSIGRKFGLISEKKQNQQSFASQKQTQIGKAYSVDPSSGQTIFPKSLTPSTVTTVTIEDYTVDEEIISHLNLLNAYRNQNGLSSLTPSRTLTDVAKWMTNDMASNNYFSHTDSLGRDPFQRMRDFEYTFNTWRGKI